MATALMMLVAAVTVLHCIVLPTLLMEKKKEKSVSGAKKTDVKIGRGQKKSYMHT